MNMKLPKIKQVKCMVPLYYTNDTMGPFHLWPSFVRESLVPMSEASKIMIMFVKYYIGLSSHLGIIPLETMSTGLGHFLAMYTKVVFSAFCWVFSISTLLTFLRWGTRNSGIWIWWTSSGCNSSRLP